MIKIKAKWSIKSALVYCLFVGLNDDIYPTDSPIRSEIPLNVIQTKQQHHCIPLLMWLFANIFGSAT